MPITKGSNHPSINTNLQRHKISPENPESDPKSRTAPLEGVQQTSGPYTQHIPDSDPRMAGLSATCTGDLIFCLLRAACDHIWGFERRPTGLIYNWLSQNVTCSIICFYDNNDKFFTFVPIVLPSKC